MGILNTLGSIALNNLKKAASKEIAKKIAPKITPAKGSGGVSVDDRAIQNIKSMPPQAIAAELSSGAITQAQVDAARGVKPTKPEKPKDITEVGNHIADEFVNKEQMTMGGSLMDFSQAKAQQVNDLEISQWAKSQKDSILYRNPEAKIMEDNIKKYIGREATLASTLGQKDRYKELKNIQEKGFFQSFVDKDNGDGILSLDEILRDVKKTSYQKTLEQKTKVISEVDKFNKIVSEYKTPQNRIEAKTKEVLGAKYEEVKKHVDDTVMYINSIASNEELRTNVPTFARAIWGSNTFNGLGDALTDGQLSAGQEALDFLNERGDVQENKLVKMGGAIVGDAPLFLGASYLGGVILPEAMVAMGTRYGAQEVGQAGLKLLQFQKTRPLLYAATFDNAYGVAANYAAAKAYGDDYGLENGARDAILGAVMPKAFDVAGDLLKKMFKGGVNHLGMKDLDVIENAIKSAEVTGDTKLSSALKAVENHVTEGGKTIGEVIEVARNNSVPTVKPLDVQLAYAKEKISLSNLAAKRLSKFTNDINELVHKDKLAAADGAQVIAEVRANILQRQYHSKTTLDDIIGGVEKKYGKTFSKFKEKASANDSISEFLHTESASMEKLVNAKTSADVVEAFTGNKPTTPTILDEVRASIDDMNRGGAKRVEDLANQHGVAFDLDKAVDKFGQANKEYLHKVMDSIDATALGYAKFAQKSLAKVRETFSSIKKNLTSASRFDAIGVGREALSNLKTLNDEVGLLTQRLKTAADAKTKVNVAEAIAKKNEQIARIKEKNAIRIKEQRALISMVKDDIDTMASDVSFSNINPVTLRALKNEAKAKIAGKTTVEQAEQIINALNEKLFKVAKKDILKKIDKTLDGATKMITRKGKPSRVSPEYVQMMSELNESINKETASITDLQILHNILKTFEKEGRDIALEWKTEQRIQGDAEFTKYAAEIKDKRIELPGLNNTPESGAGIKPTFTDNVKNFLFKNLQTHQTIERIFGRGSIADKIFNIDLSRASSRHQSVKFKLEGTTKDVIESAIKGNKHIDGDSIRNELTLWFQRKSGEDYNLWNKMWIRKQGDDFVYVPVTDGSKVPDGVIDFQSLTNDGKREVLNNIYSRYDKLYSAGGKFTENVDVLRTHFKSTGLKVKEKYERIMNKAFNAIEDYFPAVHRDKYRGGTIMGENAEFTQTYYKDGVNDNFANSRVQVTAPVNMNTDFASIIDYHINTTLYWDEMVEPMYKANAFLHRLQGGKLDADWMDEDAIMSLGGMMKEGGELMFDNSNISREALNYTQLHLGKVATRGANLRNMAMNDAAQIISKSQQYAIPIILGNIKTAAKQALSHIDIATRMIASGDGDLYLKSIIDGFNIRKIAGAMENSGLLYERMPNWFTNEGTLINEMTSTYLTNGQRYIRGRKALIDNTFSIPMRFIDANASSTAFFTGTRKWLKENAEMLRQTGRKEVIGNNDIKYLKEVLNPTEFNDMMGYAENFMSKIVGSNSIVNQGIGSQETLSKLVFFLQKTGLNRLATVYGDQLDVALGKVEGNKARALASMAMNASMSFGATYAIDESYNKFREMLGAKMPSKEKYYYFLGAKLNEDSELFGSHIAGNMAYWGARFYDSLFITPSLATGLGDGIPLIDNIDKIMKAPTLGRKMEEFGYNTVATLGGIPSNYIDGARLLGSKMLNAIGERGITKNDNAKYDEMANELIKFAKEHGDTKIEDMEQAMKDYAPIKEAKTKLAEERKVVSDNKDKVTKELLKKYGNDITQQEFYEYAKNNLDTLRSIGITDKNKAKAYYSTLMVEGGRSEGERASYLMSQPIEVIYNSTLKQHIINDDEEGFKKELQYLLDKKVIKDKNGLKKLMQMVEMEGK